MTELHKSKYHVVLHEGAYPNDLGDMTQTQLFAYLAARLGSLEAPLAVLTEVEMKGKATSHFEGTLGPPTRVEIEKVDA